jgi:hypothetical protein
MRRCKGHIITKFNLLKPCIYVSDIFNGSSPDDPIEKARFGKEKVKYSDILGN